VKNATTKRFFSKPKNATIEKPFFKLGKEAKDEGLFRLRTSMIEENFIAQKNKNTNKGYF
jgi:hypothetical protein